VGKERGSQPVTDLASYGRPGLGRMTELFSTLADGWPYDAATQRVRMVTIGHAMSYETWRSLTDRGLSDGEASELMLRLVTTVEDGAEPRNSFGEAYMGRWIPAFEAPDAAELAFFDPSS
jgi:hypothetical protein